MAELRGERRERRERDNKRVFRKKVCKFCVEKSEGVNYKDTQKLQRFLTEKGKIVPSRISGNCSRHQRILALAIKRARQIALLPYVGIG